MRTPEDYLKGIIKVNQKNLDAGIKPMLYWDEAQEAIRQAQIEAIGECAEAVTDFFYPPQGGFTKMSVEDIEALKSNILQLKNQVR